MQVKTRKSKMSFEHERNRYDDIHPPTPTTLYLLVYTATVLTPSARLTSVGFLVLEKIRFEGQAGEGTSVTG